MKTKLELYVQISAMKTLISRISRTLNKSDITQSEWEELYSQCRDVKELALPLDALGVEVQQERPAGSVGREATVPPQEEKPKK